MLCITLAALLAVAAAQPPSWYTGTCGVSKYADAGEGCPVGTTCSNVIGGVAARDNEFPWQVSVRDANGHKCGGVLLNERWVLSAATCTSEFLPAEVVVTVGAVALGTPAPTEMTYTSEGVFEHEFYSASNFDNDLSLIKTTANITLSADVTPICGPDATVDIDAVTGEVSGWGSTTVGGPMSDALMYTSLSTMTNTVCAGLFTGNEITDGMLCAGDGGAFDSRDTCLGDAGGPLGLKDAGTGAYTVIGLTSWGISCSAGYPGVYTRVSQYNQWITDKINKN